jgi:hypothetical protein
LADPDKSEARPRGRNFPVTPSVLGWQYAGGGDDTLKRTDLARPGERGLEDGVITRRIRKIETGQGAVDPHDHQRSKVLHQAMVVRAHMFEWRPDAWRIGEYNCRAAGGRPGGAGYGLVKEQLPP